MNWLNEAEKWTELTPLRRRLHQMAECGFDLPQTRRLVWDALVGLGYKPHDCGKAGIVAEVGGGEPIFLLRADMDALPITEQSGLEFAAQNGCMHACGHDMHTAMLLGAAYLLKQAESELKGTVRLMFQPAEELLTGAADMIKNGVLTGVSAGMMIHVMAGVPLKSGTVVIPQGGVGAPSADFFTVTVNGKSCHGSSPQNGVDALSAAAPIVTALQALVPSELPAGSGAVLSVGSFHAGEAANVIADKAELRGSLRAFSDEHRAFLKDRLSAVSVLTASAARATALVHFDGGCPSLLNDEQLTDWVLGNAQALLGKRKVLSAAEFGGSSIRGGSEDFAYVSQKIPTVMVALSAASPSMPHPLHHPEVIFDESVLPIGSALLASSAADWLKQQNGL